MPEVMIYELFLDANGEKISKSKGNGLSLEEWLRYGSEPSLAFYQGGTIREQSENDFLATHPSSQWPRFTVIREDVWQRTPDSVKSQLEVLGEKTGIDLADRGRTWTVFVVRKR